MVLALVLIIVIGGTLGYWIIGKTAGQDWSAFDCLYMTVITLTTVGYQETLDVAASPAGRPFTLLLLIIGSGAVLSAFGMATAYLVEGSLGEIFWRRRMQKEIDKLDQHYIVCGAGATGSHVIQELQRTHQQFVVVEKNPALVQLLIEDKSLLVCQGNAEDDTILKMAGVERAAGFVTTLPEDKDNAFVTLTARALNKKMRIVAKAISNESAIKLKRAGANATVSPNAIGGMRLASEIIRPHVVNFLDAMLKDDEHIFRLEEVSVPANSQLVGKKLKESEIHEKTGLLVVAIRREVEGYMYNPSGDLELQADDVLIVVGGPEQMRAVRKIIDS